MANKQKVVGRYAPSPSGDQHLGNLRTALLAWLHARLQGGEFLLRMEDIDTPRNVRGSAEKILRDIEWLGLDWDGKVSYQSQRLAAYQAALNALVFQQLVYPCFCSRKDIRLAASAPHGKGPIYPGICAALTSEEVVQKREGKEPALRLRVSPNLLESCGDFVIKRADGLFAYQLAVVVDDLDQAVTEVVRGCDLMSSTQRQIYLAQLLQPNHGRIKYLHAPLMIDALGARMSKRFGSYSVNDYKEAGGSSDELVGELAFGLGLIDNEHALSATELLAQTSLKDVSAVLSSD
ncbi:MAG: glutamyl-tRNA synthetase [Cryomorphaceae bacterium]|jgi:glutamyl-tRNA synthetase